MNTITAYFYRVLRTISILFNVILYGYGNQTFSARNYDWKMRNLPNLVFLIDFIFFFDTDHCEKSWVFWKTIQQAYPFQ